LSETIEKLSLLPKLINLEITLTELEEVTALLNACKELRQLNGNPVDREGINAEEKEYQPEHEEV
jgi:hypothetical protein